MTTPTIAPNIALVSIRGTAKGGQQIVMTHGALAASAGATIDLQALVTASRNAFQSTTGPLPGMTQEYVLDEVAAYFAGSNAAAAAVARTGTGAGGRAIGSYPLQVTGILTLKTAFRGKRFTGRMYVGPLCGDDCGDPRTVFAAARQQDYQTRWDSYRTQLQTAGFQMAVFSRAGGTASPVSQLLFRPYFGTQRRRLR